jgi:hypothetical protein
MRNLCDTAPKAARLLAMTILEYSDASTPPEHDIEGLKPKSDSDTTQTTKRKSAASKDMSYRPPKPPQAKMGKTNSLNKPGQPDYESDLHIGGLAQNLVSDGVHLPDTILQDVNVELLDVKSSDGVDASEDDVPWLLDQQQSLAHDDCVGEKEEMAESRGTREAAVLDKEVKEVIQETRATSEYNEAEERQRASLKSAA